MKIVLFILVTIHAFGHLPGFLKAFHLADLKQLTPEISRKQGVLWLASSVLFCSTAVLIIIDHDQWWLIAVIAVILSQFLIIKLWRDAKFGTLINVMILVAIMVGYSSWSFRNVYKKEVAQSLSQVESSDSLLLEKDIRHLPEIVKKYIRYTGALNKPKVKNFSIAFEGQLRKDEKSEWMPFSSEQHNFMRTPKRLFFMKATMKHLPVQGYHYFNMGHAFMDIRLLSLFRVQYQTGKEMGVAETVTFFNDMCCMAPATLIDNRIKWQEVDPLKVKAAFTNTNITISAWLYFNNDGELINFVSEDRYAAVDNTLKRMRWSTPLGPYKEINGQRIAGSAETIYHYPSGDLVYGTFELTNISYNPKTAH